MCRGRIEEGLQGTSLSGTSAVPGPVDSVAGRRRFDNPASITFTDEEGRPLLIQVQSALWTAVRQGEELRGVFLALNASKPDGFDHSEFEAAQQLSALVAARLKDT